MDMTKFARQSSSIILAAAVAASLMTAASAQTTQEILNYTGEGREAFLAAGAQEEGELVIYSAMIVDQALRPLAEAFMAKYPSINVTYWRGDSEDVSQRVLAEIRANNLVADVVEGTSVGASLVRAGVAEPFTTPMLDAIDEIYRDPDNMWVPTRLSYYCMAYNTDMVSEADVPKSYEELLDPRWNNQIAWRIGSESIFGRLPSRIS
jgi:iron(III) transport system substrate-binding protein